MRALLKNKEEKAIAFGFTFVFLIMLIFWLLLRTQLNYIKVEDNLKIDSSTYNGIQINQDTTVSQTFINSSSSIKGIRIKFQIFGNKSSDSILVNLYDLSEKSQLASEVVQFKEIQTDGFTTIELKNALDDLQNHKIRIEIFGENINKDASLLVTIDENYNLDFSNLLDDGKVIKGVMSFEVMQYNKIEFDRYYAIFFFIVISIMGLTILKYAIDKKNSKKNRLDILLHTAFKYQFLLSQLISRDFTTKYRRSLLGVIWSFLNPLLTMTVQYVVFSSIFRSSIDNFPVYLLSGIVVFNFFSESSNLALTSITTNSSLITKVYIPKYVFPISRVLSSAINYSLSFIPLMIVVLLTNQNVNINFLLLFYSIIFSIILFIGIGFILSTMLVFFRDMQFLWSVILMIWMYATPIFYPPSIIPPRFELILKLNPIYYIIDFNRVILLQGISPSLLSYFLIAFSSLSVLIVGMFIFKKSQDKFIFYL